MPRPFALHVNGAEHVLEIDARRTLLDTLRHDLKLTGAKKACDMGNCGACTVLMDGHAIYACLTLTIECSGRDVITIEGLRGMANSIRSSAPSSKPMPSSAVSARRGRL